jgi:adenylosuccinate synthase
VGGGPFPSELNGEEAENLRQKGNEFGSTTGRPRRVGWLDLVALKYAIMTNGLDEVFLTKLDVLDEMAEIEAVTHYRSAGKTSQVFDPSFDYLDTVQPVTERFPGWRESTCGIRSYTDLPARARDYLSFIEDYIQVPIRYVSVGSAREETIEK